MKKRFLMLIIIVISSSILFADEEFGSLAGTVMDKESGILLPGAVLHSYPLRFEGETTDINGEFRIEKIPVGKYIVVTHRENFEPLQKTVIIEKGKTTKVSINLAPNEIEYSGTTVLGTVKEAESGLPIPRAKIILDDKDELIGAESNDKGQFVLPATPAGTYTRIMADADGYSSRYKETVILSPYPVKYLHFELRKKPAVIRKNFQLKHKEYSGELDIDILLTTRVQSKVLKNSKTNITVEMPENKLKEVEEIISRYDTPEKHIWLEVRLILASNNKTVLSEIPTDLKSVIKQLKSLFQYKNYQLLDEAKMNTLENNRCIFKTAKSDYLIEIEKIEYENLNGGIIKLKNFTLLKTSETNPVISTTVNIPNGDTLILGSSGTGQPNEAMITVVTATAKVLDSK